MIEVFYVYEWYNVENGFIFYVGKGCKNRYKSLSHRNKLFLNYIKSNKCDVRIIKLFESEEMAFKFENERIIELKSQGQSVCNLDNGGTGGPQFIWTTEMRKYKSTYNPMKDEKQRKRMSEHNPMKNPLIANNANRKTEIYVVINGVEFNSINKAAKHYNVCSETIKRWCKKGINPNFEQCKYKNKEQVIFHGKRFNHYGCRPVIYKGIQYETLLDLARELGTTSNAILNWARRGFDPYGNVCRYANDLTEHVFIPYEKGSQSRKAIYVNGILYKSKSDAEKSLGLCKGYLAPYIAGTRKNNKYICKYANQQPSQENFDNSILEGSTTNE